jgi:hypothetical protein
VRAQGSERGSAVREWNRAVRSFRKVARFGEQVVVGEFEKSPAPELFRASRKRAR